MARALRRRKTPGSKTRGAPLKKAKEAVKKRAKSRLQSATVLDAQLKNILAALPEGITVQDTSGRVVFANDEGARLCGFDSAESLLSAPLEDVMAKFEMRDESGSIADPARLPGRLALQGEDGAEQLILVRELQTGIQRWSLVRATPVRDAKGRVIFAINMFYDVSEKKKKEDRDAFLLKASELLSASLDYQTTLRSVAQLVVPRLAQWCTIHIEHEDGSIENVVTAHEDPEMLKLARRLNEKYPPNYDAPQGLRHILRTGKSVLFQEVTQELIEAGAQDAEHLHIIQQLHFSSVMGVPLIVGGKAFGAISFFLTNGDRYTHDDLGFAETVANRISLAVENARLYNSITKREQEIRALNESLEAKVRERTQELEGARAMDRANFQRLKNMIDAMPLAAKALDEQNNIIMSNDLLYNFFHIDKQSTNLMGLHWEKFQELVAPRIEDPDEYRLMNRELRERNIPVTGQEVHLKGGRVLMRDYIPIFENDSFHGSLILYRDVTQERRIDATKSEFMSLASHQLRTPLTSIRWTFGRLLKNLGPKLDHVERQLLEEGKKSAARMSSTIHTMLQISLLQAGQITKEQSEIRVCDFLKSIGDSLSENMLKKELTLVLDCAEDVRLVTDTRLLKELLLNLVGNAVKYTPEKGTIRLSAKKEANTLSIYVQDTGFGIPQHQHAKIFQKFFRGENVVGKDTEGTGLGLYLVSLIAELLEGDVTFESQEGRGTTFAVRLPCA